MSSDRSLKLIIWAYFFLLIFEGALRKWVLPGLATPLLVVRDPLVLLGLSVMFAHGRLPLNGFVILSTGLGVLTFFTALAAGHGNMGVALFGWRTNYLHLPFIFVIGAGLDRADVVRMGRCLLVMSVPMALLMGVQFYSPPGSFVNIGVGGEGDAGFDGALGYKRPPGTFSFITGPMAFFPLVAAVALAAMLQGKDVASRWLALAAGLATLAAIPVSISRGLLIGVLIVVVGALATMALAGRSIRGLLQLGAFASMLFVGVNFIPGLETPREAFLARWTASTTERGGVQEALVGRVLSELSGGVSMDQSNLILGAGLGMGTNAGARLLTGETRFLIAEGEWGRVTGELGLPLGLAFIGIRVALGLWLLRMAWARAREGDGLPLLLWFSGAHLVMFGQWGTPTGLGFATLIAGLVLASAKPQDDPAEDAKEEYADDAEALADSEQAQANSTPKTHG
jgi:hypothetical protein